MAEEAKVTPEAEKIAPQEGSVEAEATKGTKEETPKGSVETIAPKQEQETVPLGTYLGLKDELKELKREIKEAKDSKKPAVIVEGLKDLSEKYPDVSKDFIQDMLSAATSQAQNEIEKKYTPIIEKQEQERKQEAFDKAFNTLFDKTLKENPDLPVDIDKDAIKALALTPKYRSVPLADILTKMYPASIVGKGSSENETRTASDRIDDIVNFENITPGQKEAILKDPKARAKYFDYLDKTGK